MEHLISCPDDLEDGSVRCEWKLIQFAAAAQEKRRSLPKLVGEMCRTEPSPAALVPPESNSCVCVARHGYIVFRPATAVITVLKAQSHSKLRSKERRNQGLNFVHVAWPCSFTFH